MPKERLDRSNPHVNIGSIGSVAMSDISSIAIAKEDLYKMFTKEQYRDYVLDQQSKLDEKDMRIKELEQQNKNQYDELCAFAKKLVDLTEFVQDCSVSHIESRYKYRAQVLLKGCAELTDKNIR